MEAQSCFLLHSSMWMSFYIMEEKLIIAVNGSPILSIITLTTYQGPEWEKAMPANRSLGKWTISLCTNIVATTENNFPIGAKYINYMAEHKQIYHGRREREPATSQTILWPEKTMLLRLCLFVFSHKVFFSCQENFFDEYLLICTSNMLLVVSNYMHHLKLY